MFTLLSDTAIMRELGNRIKDRRIAMGMMQKELADKSCVGLNTIGKIEKGQPVSVQLLISVLRTLNLLDNLELLVPETKITPMQLLELQGKKIKRVRTSKK